MVKKYVPDKGDYIILDFDPQAGKEQKGRGPAFIISSKLFNQATGMALACPVTNTDKNIPFHVRIPENSFISGVIMTEQLKSVDYKSRKAQYLNKCDKETLNQVLDILNAIIDDN